MHHISSTHISLALACALTCTGCGAQDGESPSQSGLAAHTAALTDAAAWEGAWEAIENSISIELTCDRTVQVAPEASTGDVLIIVPQAGEAFTLRVEGCELPFTVAGSVARYTGRTTCTENGPEGYVSDVTYLDATLTRRSDGTLSGVLSAEVAFGPEACQLTSSAAYTRPVVPQ
jgi:hypothetical protein